MYQQKMISDEKSPSESSNLESGSRGSPQREGEVWPPVVQSSLDSGSRGSHQKEGEVWPPVVHSSLDSGYAPTEHSLPATLWDSDII